MSQSHSRKEKGQSLVELSVVFTLLLLLVGGVIDLGSMFYTSVALRDTVQEGAIYGATHPSDTTEIVNRIQESASYPVQASQISDITITCDGITDGCVDTSQQYSCQGHEITILIRYIYPPITPIFIFHDIPLTASVTATILQSSGGNSNCPSYVN